MNEANGNNGSAPDLDRIMARIRKCLATANDTAEGGEHERDNAMRAAHAIAAKYGLSIASAEAAGRQKEEGRKEGAVNWYKEAYAGWIAGAVAELFFCVPYVQSIASQRCKYYFVGRESNVTTASEMLQYLLASIIREGNELARINGQPKDKYTRNFAKGAALHIAKRCKELRAEAERASAPATGTSLVLASHYKNELEANRRYMQEIGVNLRANSGPRIKVGGAGYREGYEFGGSVSLNRQIGGAKGGPLLK
jgi:hypothetical protein